MTFKEIKELKEKYRNEFKELIRNFFENHPYVNIIHLYYNYRTELGLDPIDITTHYYGASIPLTADKINTVITDISLKGESY